MNEPQPWKRRAGWWFVILGGGNIVGGLVQALVAEVTEQPYRIGSGLVPLFSLAWGIRWLVANPKPLLDKREEPRDVSRLRYAWFWLTGR
jgi:hypothetical protein